MDLQCEQQRSSSLCQQHKDQPNQSNANPLSFIHSMKRWAKGEIRSYDVKEHLLFSVYLKFFWIASARSDCTAKLEMGSFNSFSTKKAGFLTGPSFLSKENFKHARHKF